MCRINYYVIVIWPYPLNINVRIGQYVKKTIAFDNYKSSMLPDIYSFIKQFRRLEKLPSSFIQQAARSGYLTCVADRSMLTKIHVACIQHLDHRSLGYDAIIFRRVIAMCGIG